MNAVIRAACFFLIVVIGASFCTGVLSHGEEWWKAPIREDSQLIVRRSTEDGKVFINWVTDEIVVEGIGVAEQEAGVSEARREYMALRAAKASAIRNFLEATGMISVTSETVVRNGGTENDFIKLKSQGYVQGVQDIGTPVIEKKPDGSIMAHVWVKNSLSSFTASIYEDINELETQDIKNKVIPPKKSYDFEAVEAPKTPPPSGNYTGLIVDCRGKKARPSITPRIVDEKEEELYGSLKVSRMWLLNYGLVGYAADVESARKLQSERIGGNPLVVEPMMVSGTNRDVAVVDGKAAEMIASADKATGFLNKCGVVFVLD